MSTSDEAEAGVRPGDVLAGKYRVERVLGVGGMGVVVAAHHIQLDEKVALKFLLPDTLANAEAVARFAREAQAAVKIKSEHVARVTDVGTLPNGAPYMVMEYLEGSDLSDWLRRIGTFPIDQAVEFVLQACVAVADAHVLGIVHRDLKPANLFCVRRSDGLFSIKVLDFGISKVTVGSGLLQGGGTRTSAMMGSPYYMSPEQMRSSKDVDSQSDIWAIGIILFELIVGRPPFLSDSVMDLAICVANEPAPPLRSVRPDAPAGLEAVVARCLEKDRRKRFANVADLATALLPFAHGRALASVERITGIIETAIRSGNSAIIGSLPSRQRALSDSGGPLLPSSGQTAVEPTSGLGLGRQTPSAAGQDRIGGTLPPLGKTTHETPRRNRTLVGTSVGVVFGLAAATSFAAWYQRSEAEHVRGAAAASLSADVAPRPADHPTPAPTRVVEVAAEPVAAPEPHDEKPAQPVVPTVKLPPREPPAANAGKGPMKGTVPQTAPVEKRAAKGAEPAGDKKPAEEPSAVTPKPPAAAKCDPPYYFDDKGNRIFRKECL